MKKFAILIITAVLAMAQEDIYLQYVNKLVHYNFVLNKQTKRAPFEIKNAQSRGGSSYRLTKTVKIDLLSIFNDRAHIKIDEYLGDQLIKTKTLWVKKGSKVFDCKVDYVSIDKVVFECPHQKLVKTLNKKIPGFKELK